MIIHLLLIEEHCYEIKSNYQVKVDVHVCLLLELTSKDNAVLVINNINKIPTDEQIKFVEIFKYNKISTFELPKNCIVIATASNLKENPINEQVYSLMAHI